MGYQLVETVTVGSGGAASIEFTGIPQDGVDLVCVVSVRNAVAFPTVVLATLNSDTGSNYSYVALEGNGSSASSTSGTTTYFRMRITGSSDTANTFGNGQVYISNYTSLVSKSLASESVSEKNDATAYQRLEANSYSTTSGITSIQLAVNGQNFVEYSTASLYKIKYD